MGNLSHYVGSSTSGGRLLSNASSETPDQPSVIVVVDGYPYEDFVHVSSSTSREGKRHFTNVWYTLSEVGGALNAPRCNSKKALQKEKKIRKKAEKQQKLFVVEKEKLKGDSYWEKIQSRKEDLRLKGELARVTCGIKKGGVKGIGPMTKKAHRSGEKKSHVAVMERHSLGEGVGMMMAKNVNNEVLLHHFTWFEKGLCSTYGVKDNKILSSKVEEVVGGDEKQKVVLDNRSRRKKLCGLILLR
ncbi:unnamed protein product [Lupinus luteus]|uniref:Uncharacterized protein n=1 Tax=Lupinus luteus TaxID=3873 RepID=A0AAV1XPL5_LUPLU